MLRLKMIRPPNLLNESSTSTNISMTFWKIPILNTSSAMTNIRFYTSIKLGIRFSFICRKRGSQDPIAKSIHFNMGYTPSSLRQLVKILLN